MLEPDDIQKLYHVPQIELVYHNKIKAKDRIKITDSKIAYRIFMAAWDMNKIDLVEQCKLLLLDSASTCIGIADISSGGITSTIVDTRIIFGTALKARATGIILAHNHPTENKLPSLPDLKLTDRIAQIAQLLDIFFQDHLIICRSGYFSVNDEEAFELSKSGFESVLKL